MGRGTGTESLQDPPARCATPPILRNLLGNSSPQQAGARSISGGHQSAKISQCWVPIRSYMVSNGTLEWSGGHAQPPVARVLHLMPSVARLGPDFECSIRRV